MKRKKQRGEKRVGKPGIMAFLVRLVVLAVVAYGAWHVFCRYYPSVIRRLSGTVSAEIVDNPKSVIKISLCRTAKRNPLIFPI